MGTYIFYSGNSRRIEMRCNRYGIHFIGHDVTYILHKCGFGQWARYRSWILIPDQAASTAWVWGWRRWRTGGGLGAKVVGVVYCSALKSTCGFWDAFSLSTLYYSTIQFTITLLVRGESHVIIERMTAPFTSKRHKSGHFAINQVGLSFISVAIESFIAWGISKFE